jgi:hypothetical protein
VKEIKKFEDTNKELLIDLLWYLKENKYESDEMLVFLEIFKSIYDYSDEHIAIEPYLEESDDFVRRIIKGWEKIGKINFVHDINKSEYFSKIVTHIPYRYESIEYGYVKDEKGNYMPSCNPEYYCITKGVYDKENCPGSKQVDILFDEVEKKNNSNFAKRLTHETIHSEQDDFYIYWYFMNINFTFSQLFTEGHAIFTARRIEPNNTYLPNIPLKFKENNNNLAIYHYYYNDIFK